MFQVRSTVWLLLLVVFFQNAQARVIAVGTLGDQPAQLIRTYQPLANYLAKNLADRGYTEGRVVITKSVSEMGEMMRDSRVDIFIDSPMPTIGVNHVGGGKIILRRWKGGIAEYQSVIFTRRDSPVKTVPDLHARTIAFEQPFSSTGYILPRIIFERTGESLSPVETNGVTPPAEKIGFLFSGDDENTMEWVLRGRVDAGAMSNTNVEKYAKASLPKLKTIWESPPIPRHLVSIRSDVPTETVDAIRKILMGMDKTDEGNTILANFEKTTKFDEVPKETRELFEHYGKAVVDLLDLRQ